MARRISIANRRRGGRLAWMWRVPVCLAIWLTWAAPILGAVVAIAWLRQQARELPPVPDLAQWLANAPQSSRFVARDGTPLIEWPFHVDGEVGFRTLVEFSDIPPGLRDALLAAEDQRFFSHRGADVAAIVRAAWHNYQAQRVVSGASTITQQVARNLMPELGRERSVARKVKELLMARALERVASKEAIFAVYCNYVFLGARSHGVASAARTYFDKTLSELTVADAALLAGLVQAPSRLDPTQHPEEARARRNEVLRRMAALDMVSPHELAGWQAAPLGLRLRPRPDGEAAPWASELARRWMQATLPEALARGGLVVTVSVSPAREREAQQVVAQYAKGLGSTPASSPQAAALAWQLTTGYVEVQIGGTDYAASQFDRTTMACRQPGSAWKTVTYAAAIERGAITPATALRDAPITSYDADEAQAWKPASGTTYRGVAIARDAFAWSLNAPAIDVFDRVGGQVIIEYARHWGVASEISPRRPMALGASCVRMDELLGVYATIARGGLAFAPSLVIEVRHGQELLHDVTSAFDPWTPIARRLDAMAQPPSPGRVMTAETAFLMRSLLLAVATHGTAAAVPHHGVLFAGKTGTTNDNTDAWFVGFGAHEASAVWLGYDEAKYTLSPQQDGSHAALPLWLRLAVASPPSASRDAILGPPPPSIARYRIDPATGLLAGSGLGGRDIWLLARTAPTEVSDGIGALGIDAARTSSQF